MKRLGALLVVLLALPATASGGEAEPLRQWGQWRGPLATGVAPYADPPVRWSEAENIRWKAKLPGLGHSTPVVWGDRVIVTAAVPHGDPGAPRPAHAHADGAHDNFEPLRKQRFVVLAYRRKDGKQLWQRVVRDERPHEGTHVTGSWASASPITDGRRIYAHFGSRGLYALSWEGKLLWSRDLGDMESRHGHGEGSSPVLAGGLLVVPWDHQGASFLVALDAATGKERWRVVRDEITAWSTPIVVDHRGRKQVIVAATGRVRGYDLKSGKEIWACGGLSRNVVASPVYEEGVVYVANSYDTRAMLAIRLDAARGDVTGNPQAVLWTRDRNTPYVPSPILYDGQLCFLRHLQGRLTCVDAPSGHALFEGFKLRGLRRVFASPAGAGGRIYIPSRDGVTAVLARGKAPKVLAYNRLEDSFTASPALAGGELYLRGEQHLYCIAAGATPD